MSNDLEKHPEYLSTIKALEARKRVTEKGAEYWMAREIHEVLGYPVWGKFEPVIERTRDSLRSMGKDPSHHIAPASKMVGIGSGAQRSVEDYFLNRGACRLIAMNGDPRKPAIAGAQAYFVVQTERMEQADRHADDEKRLEQREKVTASFKAVSGIAQEVGVRGPKQALFHSARYEGMYNQTSTDYRSSRGLAPKENPFDRMGTLELSAHGFQMNLAAETIESERIRGEAAAIRKNKEIAQRVRKTMIDSGVKPEQLPVAEPIKEVRKRVNGKAAKAIPQN